MTDKLQIFGATPSPYTQKMISICRYRHIPYEAYFGDVAGKLTKNADAGVGGITL